MLRTLRCSMLLLAAAGCLASSAGAQRGTPRPVLSPRDTVQLVLDSRHRVYVDYGRPTMRGRRIMGGLVPWGQVWRTGANAATTLVTDLDLDIAGQRVPRGTYTLYTVPSRLGWLLIINRQTGQWGTEYHETRDLVRIPLQVTPLRDAVERFTIALERRSGGGTLALSWENTRAAVPFRVAPAPAAPRR